MIAWNVQFYVNHAVMDFIPIHNPQNYHVFTIDLREVFVTFTQT